MNDSNNTLREPHTNAVLPARFETTGPLLIAGLREPLDEHAAQKIPQLWQRLTARRGQIPQRVGNTNYGLCIHASGFEYYYMAGCAVCDFTGLPETLSPFIVPSQTYAVFTHEGHINNIRETIGYAFDQWLPKSGYRQAIAPENGLHFFRTIWRKI